MGIKQLRKRAVTLKMLMGAIFICVAVIVLAVVTFRFDYAGGTHLITPTAIDSTLFGNYRVYYRTSVFTGNAQEDFYYLDGADSAILIPIINDAILHSKQIIVYYPRYIGFKGIFAPPTAPIKSIDIIKK